MLYSTTQIYDMNDVSIFLMNCISVVGMAFHPDTDFADYKDEHGNMLFPDDYKTLDVRMYDCFRICEWEKADIYALTEEFAIKLGCHPSAL